MRSFIVILPVLDELKELLQAALLDDADQGGCDSLGLAGRDLGDLSFAVYKGSRNLLKFQVPRDIGVCQESDNFSVSHHELWNKVNVVVSVTTQIGRNGFVGAIFAVKLREAQR